jgi:hypothetical protein
MTLSVKGTEDLGLVTRNVGASPTLAAGANSVALLLAEDGEGVQYQETPILGGVAGTRAHYKDTPNQSSGAIYYWTPANVAAMTGFALTFTGSSANTAYCGMAYWNVNEFGFDASQNWDDNCSTCGAGNNLYGNVGIPAGCVDGQFLHVMVYDGYSGHNGLTGAPTQVFTYDSLHNAGHYKVNTTTLNQGYSSTGLGFYRTALGVVFYEADTDIVVSPDPVTITVTAPTHTETGAYPDITEHDNQAQVKVTVPIPTIIVTHPQQLPLVGVHEEMPGRVPPATGLTTPLLTESENIPQWTEGDGTLRPADHAHTATGDGGTVSHAVLTSVTTDDHHAKSHGHDGVDGSGTVQTWEDLRPLYNGSTVEHTTQSVGEDTGTVYLYFEQSGGGDVTFIFNGAEYDLDCTPIASVALTAGTDAIPQLNYVYCTESGGTVTLTASTTGWPTAEDFAPIATVLVPTAAHVATDGVYKHHAWTDHVTDGREVGHLGHINAKLRALQATWVSGCAANNLVIVSPDAHFVVDAGEVFQLHPHDFPSIDVSDTSAPGGVYLMNDPTTPNKHIHTFDDITQDAAGGAINNRWFSLVVWGVVSENAADCKLFINLPNGTYSNEASAQSDSDNYAVYTIPADYTGTGFLISKYIVQGKTSGLWVQSANEDLRGLFPAVSPGAGTSITDHGGLAGLGDDDHTQYQTSARVDTQIATHASVVDAHHARYTDGEAVTATAASYEAAGAIATHAAVVDAHHAKYTDAEAVSATAASYEPTGAVATHTGDATDAHDASAISVLDTAGNVDAIDVEAAIAEIYTDMGALGAGTPASTVASETTYGIAAAVGVGTDYARNDHTHGSPADPDVAGAISTHAGSATAHHTRYADAEAVAAVEATASLDLVGDITMDANKSITFANESNTIGSSTYGVETLYVDNILGVTGANVDVAAASVRLDGATDVRFYSGASDALIIWDGNQFYVTEASTSSKRLGHSANYWDEAYIENIYVSGNVDGVDVSARDAYLTQKMLFVKAQHTAGTSVNNTTATPVEWNSVLHNNTGVASTTLFPTGNVERFNLYAVKPGWWKAWGTVGISADPDGYRRVLLYDSVAAAVVAEDREPAVTGAASYVKFSFSFEVTATGYFYLQGWQNGGSTETFDTTNTMLNLQWICDS